MHYIKTTVLDGGIFRLSYDGKMRPHLGNVIVAVPKISEGQAIGVNSPLFVLETNRRLCKISTPIRGTVVKYNKKLECCTPPSDDLWLCDIYAMPSL